MLDQGTALKRRIIDTLRPSTLDMLGLAPAARDLVETFAAEARVIVDAEIDEEIELPADDALVLYRIIEEALSNIRKHAGASHAWVELGRSGDIAHLLVRDDGKGFDASPASKSGHGIPVMRQRIHSLGGEFAATSVPGSGTTIEVWLPVRTT
jgi:signal transduction histidine kinase